MGVIRDLPADEIERLLHEAIVFRIACQHPDTDRPYLVPISLAYAGDALYGYTGPGTKLRAMRANPRVSIEVDSATASDSWESAVLEGEFIEITTDPERTQALRIVHPEPAPLPQLGAMTTVFRIAITQKTGRIERPT